jgi:hypothetical protein
VFPAVVAGEAPDPEPDEQAVSSRPVSNAATAVGRPVVRRATRMGGPPTGDVTVRDWR